MKQVEAVCGGVVVHHPDACRSPAIGAEGNEIASLKHSGRYGVEESFDRGEDATVVCRGTEDKSIVTENITQGSGEIFGAEIVQGYGNAD